jgi:GDSL-like Lipase/Acylhydrolase family
MVAEGFRAFLNVVRQGHPATPVVVVSPLHRPDADGVHNTLGASLADIRHAIESVARERIVSVDAALSFVTGEGIIGEEHLVDEIHPGDEGHKRIAATVGKALTASMRANAGVMPTDDFGDIAAPDPGSSTAPDPDVIDPVDADRAAKSAASSAY